MDEYQQFGNPLFRGQEAKKIVPRHTKIIIAWVWLHMGLGLLIGQLFCPNQCTLADITIALEPQPKPLCSQTDQTICIDTVCYAKPVSDILPTFRTRLFSTRLLTLEFTDATGRRAVVKDRSLLDCVETLIMPQS